MKSLKVILWITAVGCLVAVPFTILPWSVIQDFIKWFGIVPIPDNLLAMYIIRVSCGVYGLIGIFFIILANNPLNYVPMVRLGAYGLIIFSLLAFGIGINLKLSPIVYMGDFLGSLILGIAIIILLPKTQSTVSR